MKESQLFVKLPEEYICTPDGMTIDRHGNLILSCPNYANEKMSGCVVRIHPDRRIEKWFDAPVHPETGVARNMGIEFDSDWNVYLCDNQGWSEKPELVFKGRVLRIEVDDAGVIAKSTVIAYNMEHPNGIRIRGDYLYVTQSYLHPVKDESGKLVSCVYRFRLDDHDIKITNTLDDPNIFATFITANPDCQYGADGIAFDKSGNLYVGNFGDGEIYRITFNEDGTLKDNKPFAKDPSQLQSTDGMIFDDKDNLYIADFCANSIVKVSPDGKVDKLAQSPDSDGLHGELDQPGEPIIWNGKIIVSCFDLVTGPDKVNTAHELPATIAEIDL